MQSFESEVLINARSSTVWEVITDTANFAVWDSGITEIEGELRNGGTVRVKTMDGGRAVRLRVQQLPGEVMVWRSGLPLGLLRRTQTFVLSPQDGLTRLRVTNEISGPLLRFTRAPASEAQRVQAGYTGAVKHRAELLDRQR